jgi:hypothetical protein
LEIIAADAWLMTGQKGGKRPMNQRKASKRTTNHLIAVLSMAMGQLNIRGYFTIRGGIWILWRNETPYPLIGLRGVMVTANNQIILDLPGSALVLRGETTIAKDPLTITSSQEAHEIT